MRRSPYCILPLRFLHSKLVYSNTLASAGIAAKIEIRTRNWKWAGAAGIALIIGWLVVFGANMDSL